MQSEVQILKEEIKKLKQQLSQQDLRLSVHKAIHNGSEVILQAPSSETLKTMYGELENLGIIDHTKRKREKINPIVLSKVTASSKAETDLTFWFEKIKNREHGKSYIKKEPKLKRRKTPGKKPYNPIITDMEEETPILIEQQKEQQKENLPAEPSPFHTPLRNSRSDKKLSSSSSKKRSSGLSRSSNRLSNSESNGKTLKRELNEAVKDAPFDAPVWKKRRSMQNLGVDELNEYCQRIILNLSEHEASWPFLAPVDVVGLELDDYLTIITHPMDLGTINRKLCDQEYRRIGDFISDVRLVWSNCKRYNNETLEVHKLAVILEKIFEEKLRPILPYVQQNAPLLKNETLQKSITQLQSLHAKLLKQQQQTQQAQQKPKQPHLIDASPATLSRDAVPNTVLLPEQLLILAEEVTKLEMKYMRGLIQIINEDTINTVKTDTNIVEVNMGNLDNISLRRIVQYVEDCKTDRRLRKNQSRRKHRESKAAAGGTTPSRPANRNNRNRSSGGNFKEKQILNQNSDSESESSSSDSSDSDSEENTPKKQKKNKIKEFRPLSSNFEMGDNDLTDFNNSSTWIGEDAFTNETNLEQEGKGGSIWEDIQEKPVSPKQKKKEEKKKEEKATREEKRRLSKSNTSQSKSKTTTTTTTNYESTLSLPGSQSSTFGSSGSSGLSSYMSSSSMNSAALASAVGMSATASIYGGMNPYGYGMYGVPNSSLYGMNPATMTAMGLTPTGATTTASTQSSQMSAYQYQQYQQAYYQQYQYQQYQYQYQQQLLAQTQPSTQGTTNPAQ